jgi:hypothetical protein
MAPTLTGIDVDRPAEEVYAYATDPTRFHEPFSHRRVARMLMLLTP